MPLDSLEQAAGPLIPRSRTNYFDPEESGNIIARYANSGRSLQDAQLLAKAATDLQSSRMARAEDAFRRQRQDRQVTEWDREDQQYQDLQNWKADRGNFLSQLSQIDPEADDYEQQRSELYSKLPLEAQKDDAVRDIVAAKDRVFQAKLANREKEAYRQTILDERRARQEDAAAQKFGSMGLNPDEFVRDPDSGEIDIAETAFLAGERARQLQAATHANRDATVEAKKAEEDAKDLLADQDAFPTQLSQFYRANQKKDDTTTKESELRDLPGFEAAKAYDKDKYASEKGSATRMTRDEYIAKGGSGLSEVLQKKRGEFWDHAHAGRNSEQQYVDRKIANSEAPRVRRWNPETKKIE